MPFLGQLPEQPPRCGFRIAVPKIAPSFAILMSDLHRCPLTVYSPSIFLPSTVVLIAFQLVTYALSYRRYKKLLRRHCIRARR
jgi:hypothetical protein